MTGHSGNPDIDDIAKGSNTGKRIPLMLPWHDPPHHWTQARVWAFEERPAPLNKFQVYWSRVNTSSCFHHAAPTLLQPVQKPNSRFCKGGLEDIAPTKFLCQRLFWQYRARSALSPRESRSPLGRRRTSSTSAGSGCRRDTSWALIF